MSELSKYLNEQLGVYSRCETKKVELAKDMKNVFLNKNVFE